MALWSGGGVLTARVGHGVVELGGVDSSLVRAALVLDHGGLSAEALQAAVMGALVRSLAGVDAAMSGKT